MVILQRLLQRFTRRNGKISTKYCNKYIKRLTNNTALIIGGGPCGTMTALSLQKQGIKSIIFERKKSGSNEDEGSGMLLHGGGECMKYLGYKNELYSVSSPSNMVYKSMDNTPFITLDYKSIHNKYGVEKRWVLRKNLFKLLQDLSI